MTGKWEGLDKIWKKKKKRRERGKQYMGSLHKIRMLAPLCQLCKETLKVSHASHPPIITAPPPPIISSKISHPPITAVFAKFHSPTFMKGCGGRGGGLTMRRALQVFSLHLIYKCNPLQIEETY